MTDLFGGSDQPDERQPKQWLAEMQDELIEIAHRHGDFTGEPWSMRDPCPRCGHEKGTIKTQSGQDRVFCADCGRHAYNAPRSETGRPQRTLRTRPQIKPSKRMRVLERDNHTCVSCHRADVDLDIGHLLSVEDGHRLGFSNDELNDEENLAAMCAACNSGQGHLTHSLRLVGMILRARLDHRRPSERALDDDDPERPF